MPILTLIRGLPGSGKSTIAAALAKATGALHVEADMYFTDGSGNYHFTYVLLSRAHGWCESHAHEALRNGRNAIVSNTFTTQWEMDGYLRMAKKLECEVQIIECTGDFENGHSVPVDTLAAMKARWEQINRD